MDGKSLFQGSESQREWVEKNALPPMVMEDVRIDRVVDVDAFGFTYEGLDQQIGKPVIIREYFPYGSRLEDHSIDSAHVEDAGEFEQGLPRVAQKLAALSRLRHPGMVRGYAMIRLNGTLYALYECVKGHTLENLWKVIPVVAPQQAVQMFAPVADALQAMLDSGVEPDEINPKNIVVRDEDGLCTIRFMGTTFSWNDPTNLILKKTYPIPQEAYAWYQPCDVSPDHQYRLAAIVYRAITGTEPSVDGNPHPPAGITPEIDAVLTRGMAKEPKDRYASVREMWLAFCKAVMYAPIPQPAPAEAEDMPPSKTSLPTEPVKELTPGPEAEDRTPQSSAIPEALPDGTQIGQNLTVKTTLSRDAFGFRYLGYDREQGKEVIIREYALYNGTRGENGMDWNPGFMMDIHAQNAKEKQQLFARLSKVRHPGIVSAYAAVEANGTFYAVQEKPEGVRLPEMWANPTLTPDDIWSPSELATRFDAVAEALGQLSGKGILEPLKLNNFTLEPSPPFMRLVDLCTTFPTEKMDYYTEYSDLEPREAFEWYNAPDVMQNAASVEPRVQYTLCAILYRMMGVDEPLPWIERIQNGDKLPPLDAPDAVNAVIRKGLSLNPKERYASIAEMWQAFKAAASPEPPKTYTPEPEERCHSCMEKLGSDPVCPHCGYNNMITLEVGKVLPGVLLAGRYQTGRELGWGGEYMTYIGYDQLMGQKIAIREFYPANLAGRAQDGISIHPLEEERYRSQFIRRRRENIALIKDGRMAGVEAMYDLFDENGTFYVIKEYIEGISFREWLKRKQTFLTLEEAESVLRPAAEVLVHLHEKGMAHGDICPQNLMVDADGRNGVWIDRSADRCLAAQNEEGGKADLRFRKAFSPPECCLPNPKVPSALSDEYAFCAVLYCALTGKLPAEALRRTLDKEPLLSICEINPTVSPAVEQVIFKGMEPKAENRYPSMQEWLTAMENACASGANTAKKTLWQKFGFHKGKK